jgi:hypothetical protein
MAWHTSIRYAPPQPRVRVFADRADGTLYYLSHNDDATLPALGSAASLPAGQIIPTAAEEPVMPCPLGRIRLYVEDADLTYEVAADGPRDLAAGVQDEPVFTIRFGDRTTILQITADEVATFGDPLCLTRYTGLGTTTVITSLGCDYDVIGEVEEVIFESDIYEPGIYE